PGDAARPPPLAGRPVTGARGAPGSRPGPGLRGEGVGGASVAGLRCPPRPPAKAGFRCWRFTPALPSSPPLPPLHLAPPRPRRPRRSPRVAPAALAPVRGRGRLARPAPPGASRLPHRLRRLLGLGAPRVERDPPGPPASVRRLVLLPRPVAAQDAGPAAGGGGGRSRPGGRARRGAAPSAGHGPGGHGPRVPGLLLVLLPCPDRLPVRADGATARLRGG